MIEIQRDVVLLAFVMLAHALSPACEVNTVQTTQKIRRRRADIAKNRQRSLPSGRCRCACGKKRIHQVERLRAMFCVVIGYVGAHFNSLSRDLQRLNETNQKMNFETPHRIKKFCSEPYNSAVPLFIIFQISGNRYRIFLNFELKFDPEDKKEKDLNLQHYELNLNKNASSVND